MEKFRIVPIIRDLDINEISNWDTKYENDPRYDSIREFILENNIYYNIGEVIETNYELFPIGNNERKYALAIKNDKEIMGFILAIVHELQTSKPELIIQYIVLNPDYQNQGYGEQVLKELISNSEQYFNTDIFSVFAKINVRNKPSMHVFNKVGFKFYENTKNYVVADLEILENKNE